MSPLYPLRVLHGWLHKEFYYVVSAVMLRRNKAMQHFFRTVNIDDSEATVRRIVEGRLSVSRFGDGEMFVIKGSGNGFQHYDEKLRERLLQVFHSAGTGGVLVCVPYSWKDISLYSHDARVFFTEFLLMYGNDIMSLVNPEYHYGNALFSRFYMDYKDRSGARARLDGIRRIWQDRDVYIVEGELTRMGVGNDLLDNARSVRRILAPSREAFSRYEEIMSAIKANVPHDDNVLILLALGMTATVLAYDLSRLGWQTVDIGHIDVEYEWMRMGAKKKVPLPTRFVNEVHNYDEVQDCDDTGYRNQVIAEVK